MPLDIKEIEQALAEADCLATEQEVAAAIERMAAEITARLKGINRINSRKTFGHAFDICHSFDIIFMRLVTGTGTGT